MPRRLLVSLLALGVLAGLFCTIPSAPIDAQSNVHLSDDQSEAADGRAPVAQLAVKLEATANAANLANTYEAQSSEPIHGLSGWYVWRYADLLTMESALAAVRADTQVLAVARQFQANAVRKTNDPFFGNQYHLKNTGQLGGQAGTDINAEAAWLAGYTGAGVKIGIVDDGIEVAHEDLNGNYQPALSFDFLDNDPDPSPASSNDDHGTSVAGLAVASGENGVGVVGAAYGAGLSALRLVGTGQTTALEASALGYKANEIAIYNNSWGPPDDGNYHPISNLPRNAIRNGAATGRNGLGSIYVRAGGNGGSGDWSNLDGYANMPETIAVGSMTRFGNRASYSEQGANIVCVAPGGSSDVYTTDRSGSAGYNNGGLLANPNYTPDFGGTSASTPMVSGVIALMLEANPFLTWRDVQHILARTCRQVQPSDPGWVVNAAGFEVHHGFGFGLVDADAATATAATWVPIGARRAVDSVVDVANTPIPDNDPNGVTRVITFSTPLFLEHVELDLTLTHPAWGDLIITLTSPSGTVSQLSAKTFGSSPSGNNYTFMTVHDWGEASAGSWTLKIVDAALTDHGDISSWKLTFYGTDEAVGASGGVPPVVNTIDKPTVKTGEDITISGAFLSGARVKIGGVTAEIIANSSTTIVARVSAMTPLGTQALVVTTLSGTTSDPIMVLDGGPIASFSGGSSGGGCALSRIREEYTWLLAFLFATMGLALRRRHARGTR